MRKDAWTQAAVEGVFADLLDKLAWAAVYDPANSNMIVLDHPFICEQGEVAKCFPYEDVGAMKRQLTRCRLHEFVDSGVDSSQESPLVCRRHPVITDGQLAALALGGIDAVLPRKRAFIPLVHERWEGVLGALERVVQRYDEWDPLSGEPPENEALIQLGDTAVRITVRPKTQKERLRRWRKAPRKPT